ncbi:hypothetical protein POM88_011943 [Heracleum sosnowskyi]|uniref:DUF7731 domain-containing protein n=1 Tax=Heracleum sosnowskyi TaxID=360622 RepID=A0AAD8IVI4_9APIA|nr:hypothetical protein POM88_011943 [Heracleum sosnowskyi]
MESSTRTGDRSWFVCCFLMTVLLMFCNIHAAGDGVIKQIRDPTSNVNLTPFEQWLSAYNCMLNKSKWCSEKYQLSGTGWVNVTQADTNDYCSSGCAAHTKAVLLCVSLVKRDYKFADKSTVKEINVTITNGCNQGFTGHVWKEHPSSSAKRFSVTKLAIFSMAALLFMMS